MKTWDKSQAIRQINKDKFTKIYQGDFILTGLLKCPQCGSSMISHRSKKKNKPNEFYRYYQCSNFFNKGTSICKSNLVKADTAEKYVLDRIDSIIKRKEIIDCMLQKIITKNTINIHPLKKRIKTLEDELCKIEIKRKQNLQMNYDDTISYQILNQQIIFLKEKEDIITPQLNALKLDLAKLSYTTDINTEDIITILKNFTTIFSNSTIEQKKSLLHSIIESISVNSGNCPKERTIDKIKLFFEPDDIQAQNSDKKFATTYDTVHFLLF